MRIGLATPAVVEGDAVSNDIMGMYLALKKAGHTTTLFADSAHISLPVQPIQNAESPPLKLDMFIYHHSINCESGVNQFVKLKCRKVMKYHNITPPHFFEDDPHTQKECQRGYDQLKIILDQEAEFWADSEYNGLELQKTKAVPFKVIPPINQSDILLRIQSDPHPVLSFDDWNTNIIMVGRVAPNKDNIAAVEAFAEYYKRNKNSRLIIVGGTWGSYGDKVRKRIADLELPNVVITGKVPIEVLKAFYTIADLLLITSKHEGFCVPMIEAMAMGVPVLANRECALPYTGKDAVYYANNPGDIAAGIECVLNNKLDFIKKGRQLFKETYQNSSIESVLLSAVNSTQA